MSRVFQTIHFYQVALKGVVFYTKQDRGACPTRFNLCISQTLHARVPDQNHLQSNFSTHDHESPIPPNTLLNCLNPCFEIVRDDDFISAKVFCLRRLGEVAAAEAAAEAPRPVLLARRDCVTADRPGGLSRRPPLPPPPRPPSGAVALLCSGRMEEVRDGVIKLWRTLA